jgi:hypothetical protein
MEWMEREREEQGAHAAQQNGQGHTVQGKFVSPYNFFYKYFFVKSKKYLIQQLFCSLKKCSKYSVLDLYFNELKIKLKFTNLSCIPHKEHSIFGQLQLLGIFLKSLE